MPLTEKVELRFDAEWDEWAPKFLNLDVMSPTEIQFFKLTSKNWFLIGATITLEIQLQDEKGNS